MNRLLRQIKDERGSALVTVFITIVVLLLLGAGLMALSVGTAKQSVAVDTFEKLYYPAEGASVQGVEHIRQQVLQAYNQIQADLLDNVHSTNNEASFFAMIDAAGFAPTPPDKTTGSAVDTLASGITGSGSGDTRTYTVVSTAVGGSQQREVKGTLTVKFTPLEQKFSPFGDKALVVGDSLDCSGAKQGTSLLAPDGIEVDSILDPDHIDSSTPIYPPPPDRNLNWVLNFSSFSTYIAGIIPNCTPAYHGHGSGKYYGFENQTFPYMYYVGDAATNYEMHGVNITTGGKLVSYKDLTILDGVQNNVVIITAGDMYIDGCTIQNASVFVGGTLYVRAGNAKETRLIKSIIYAKNVVVGDQGNGKTEIVSGLLYSYNDILINGNKYGDFAGQVISRGDTVLTGEIPNKTAMFDYDENILKNLPAMLQSMGAAPFIEALKNLNGGSMYTVPLLPNNSIFSGGKVAEN